MCYFIWMLYFLSRLVSKKGDSFGGDIIEKRGFSSFLGVKKERKNEISNDMKGSGMVPYRVYFWVLL